MAYRLFEGKEHASAYKKYRVSPTKEVLNLILTYLEKRKEKPFLLAVDVGCGSGQGTIGLAPHFQKVVGIDVSEAQLEEARREPGFTNVSYRSVEVYRLLKSPRKKRLHSKQHHVSAV
ncbi:UNVERIFIED_CONTAM: hypothetical protein FKN15_013064 [Acipenser sinensis]